jgi:Na+/H+ antiporter NhaC
VTPRAHRALLPVLTFVGLTLFEIVRVGLAAHPQLGWSDLLELQGITAVLGEGDSTRAILIGSTAGLLVAVVLALFAGLRREIPAAAWATVRSMGVAVAILYLAWMIGAACDQLGTAVYLSEVLSERVLAPLLPSLLFLLAAAVAFSTGSSWSTMSILLPLVVGLAYTIGRDSGFGGGGSAAGHLLLVMSIGAVLEGSIFGDHCSPLSDTTVLSSTAAASDHIDHVRTQAPYALTVMLISLLCGYLPCALLGLSPWLALLAAAAVLTVIAFTFGRPTAEHESA